MRPDMAKIIVERPRGTAWRGRASQPVRTMRHAAKRDPENAIAIRGMRRLAHVSRGKHRKFLNENLAPLRRFLHRSVGRPWNDVYSEISQHIRLSSAVQFHILQHIGDFVARPSDDLNRHWYPPLWVDPADGILKRRARKPRARGGAPERTEPTRRYVCDAIPERQYWQVGNVWYRIACRSCYLPDEVLGYWNSRVPSWFMELIDRSIGRCGMRLWLPQQEADLEVLAIALGRARFPMAIEAVDRSAVLREFRAAQKRGMPFRELQKRSP